MSHLAACHSDMSCRRKAQLAVGRGFRGEIMRHLELPQVLLTVDRGLLFICESKSPLAEQQLADHSLGCYVGPEWHD